MDNEFKVNNCLRDGTGLKFWRIFLQKFINGIKHFDFYKGKKAFRGFKHFKNVSDYEKGSIVCWNNIAALSKSFAVAQKFSKDENGKDDTGTIFIVETLTARDISSISQYQEEEEVILQPYTYFEVVDVKENIDKPNFIVLKEISIPRSEKVVFWVDDKPEDNYEIAYELEIKGYSVVFCTSTKMAIKVIENFRWIVYFTNANIKIVTDMVRNEEGKMNYEAGIDLIEEIRMKFHYSDEIMLFCKDITKTSENCKKRKLIDNFKICNRLKLLREFLNFD